MNTSTKKSRKRKTKDPCGGCGMHHQLCFCLEIPRLLLKTKLSLIIHFQEAKRTTNTGKIAVRALENSDYWVRGEKDKTPFSMEQVLDSKYRPLVLYPSEGARILDSSLVSESNKPIQLIVPDGNWRQAGKVIRRYPLLEKIEKVKIEKTQPSHTQIRKETSEFGMATLQAIAYAFHVLEGPQIGDALDLLYLLKAQRTFDGRGQSLYNKPS